MFVESLNWRIWNHAARTITECLSSNGELGFVRYAELIRESNARHPPESSFKQIEAVMATTTAAKEKSSTLLIYPSEPLEIDFGALLKPMDDDEFFYFCQRHRDLRIEMDKFGEIIIMSPTGSETGRINFILASKFANWSMVDGTGEGFDSSTGFVLPNGAKRSPDLAWIKRQKWLAIPVEQRKKFAPICPDFVVEIRSESDPLNKLQAKMAEYIENGAGLGWLLDVNDRKIYVYKPNVPVQILENPAEISGEPLLKGFVLHLAPIFG